MACISFIECLIHITQEAASKKLLRLHLQNNKIISPALLEMPPGGRRAVRTCASNQKAGAQYAETECRRRIFNRRYGSHFMKPFLYYSPPQSLEPTRRVGGWLLLATAPSCFRTSTRAVRGWRHLRKTSSFAFALSPAERPLLVGGAARFVKNRIEILSCGDQSK